MRNVSFNLLYYPFRMRLLRGHEIAVNNGIPVRFFELHRSHKRQSELYSQGRTTGGKVVTNAPAGMSYHQYGVAADLVMFVGKQWDWSCLHHYKAMVPIMQSVGLEGLFTMGDWPHWQLAGLPPVAELAQIYKSNGLEGVWEFLDKSFG